MASGFTHIQRSMIRGVHFTIHRYISLRVISFVRAQVGAFLYSPVCKFIGYACLSKRPLPNMLRSCFGFTLHIRLVTSDFNTVFNRQQIDSGVGSGTWRVGEWGLARQPSRA